jgi:hypothetical protein
MEYSISSALPLFEDADWVVTLKDCIISLGKEVVGMVQTMYFQLTFLSQRWKVCGML